MVNPARNVAGIVHGSELPARTPPRKARLAHLVTVLKPHTQARAQQKAREAWLGEAGCAATYVRPRVLCENGLAALSGSSRDDSFFFSAHSGHREAHKGTRVTRSAAPFTNHAKRAFPPQAFHTHLQVLRALL